MLTLETFKPIIIPTTTTTMDFSIQMFDEKYEESKKNRVGTTKSSLRGTTTTTTAAATSVNISEIPTSSLPSSSTTFTKSVLARKQKKNKVIQKYLPTDFAPSPYTVILGRGKKCTESCGNRRLRIIATTFLGRYTKATSKEQKSIIVSEILAIVQEANQNQRGAFVREICNSNNDASTPQWIEVSITLAREKIGQVLRNLLHTKYRSSIKNKVKARREKRLASSSSSSSFSYCWQKDDSNNYGSTTTDSSSSSSSSSCSTISSSSCSDCSSSSISNHSSRSTNSSGCCTENMFFDEEEEEEEESYFNHPDDNELLIFTEGLFS